MNCWLYAFPENNAFGILNLGYTSNIAYTRFGPAQRNNYIIHYVLSGKGFFNNCPVKAGQGFLITPNMSEHYYPDDRDPWKYVFVILKNLPAFDDLFKEYKANPQTNIFEYSNISLLIQYSDMIKKNSNKIYSSPELYEMFLHLFNNHNVPQNRRTAAETMYFKYAVEFINSNIFRKIKVADLTDMLGVSQPYIYNIFIKNALVSPKKYIDTVKIKRAKELLIETTLNLTEVGNSVGIDDCITFSKFFKKNTGISPSDFRKTNMPL